MLSPGYHYMPEIGPAVIWKPGSGPSPTFPRVEASSHAASRTGCVPHHPNNLRRRCLMRICKRDGRMSIQR